MVATQTYNYATNVLMNTNIKRCSFYTGIDEFYSQNGICITHNDLIEIGKTASMKKAHIDDEIIGCLYANLLTKETYESKNYKITERAIRDFYILKTEGCFQEHQINIKVFFEGNCYRLFIWLVETFDNEYIKNILDRGWTRNKSKQRLMKKCKTIYETIFEIEYLVNCLNASNGKNTAFKEIIRNYGRYWSNLDTYTVNLADRCNYSSETMIKYTSFYKALLDIVGNSVDWGGKDILISDFLSLSKEKNIFHEGFLSECFDDGMIRYISADKLTITGHANTVINKYFDSTKVIDFIVRNEQCGYSLLVGDKTGNSKNFTKNLSIKMKMDSLGWYYTNKLHKIDVIEYISDFLRIFDENVQISINSLNVG